ncbi:ABC transporter permease [Paenibacillus rhizosphaerae]|uniref:ABC transporter permease n=1 Tax=Paenibacillus rhizosphaerae TaxID=297318 RepID=A0A1R1ELM5_9BACL|nr:MULTISPECIES: carbohydrate ABC transporter permease [Paenibacillus]OMF52734.1 ABC transporter permease [Paenibacillus rhizosphaerae]UYO06177.1 carbohydrate ABC transporter permease [Paenibacillus sp. PSB04]
MMHKLRRLRTASPFQVMLITLFTALALFMSLPIVFIFNHAFKPQNELFLFPPRFFVRHPTLHNFETLFLHASNATVPFTRYLFNSLIVVSLTLVSVVVVSTMAAYVLAKYQFHFKQLIMSLITLSLMFAPETVSIPRYLVINGIGLNNTYLGHILPSLASPVAVFMLVGFISQIPSDLMEAARIDGAGHVGIFVRMILPLSVPAIATISILTFQGVWGDVETSTLFMQKETMRTLAFYVNSLLSGLQNNVAGQNMAAAAGLLIFIPNLIIFLLFQRRVLETMVHSGIK